MVKGGKYYFLPEEAYWLDRTLPMNRCVFGSIFLIFRLFFCRLHCKLNNIYTPYSKKYCNLGIDKFNNYGFIHTINMNISRNILYILSLYVVTFFYIILIISFTIRYSKQHHVKEPSKQITYGENWRNLSRNDVSSIYHSISSNGHNHLHLVVFRHFYSDLMGSRCES